MEIIFSGHSKDQNRIRKIPLARVRQTLEKPDKILSSFRGRKLYRKTLGDKILEVVAKIEGEKIVVITQYYLK
jgi:hypothetical protein